MISPFLHLCFVCVWVCSAQQIDVSIDSELNSSLIEFQQHFSNAQTYPAVQVHTCPAGYYCTNSTVMACPVGTYQPWEGAVDSRACQPCLSLFTICPLEGMSQPLSCLEYDTWAQYEAICSLLTPVPLTIGENKSECPVGYYFYQEHKCARCEVGYFCGNGSRQLCAEGAFSASTGATACNVCPDGTFATASSSSCTECPLHHHCHHGLKQPCPRGTYIPYLGASAASSCLPCSLGTYSYAEATPCVPCPANAVCSNTTTLSPCPLHTVSPEGSTSMLSCVCLAGYQCDYSKQIKLYVPLNATSIPMELLDMNNATTVLQWTTLVAQTLSLSVAQVRLVGFRYVAT